MKTRSQTEQWYTLVDEVVVKTVDPVTGEPGEDVALAGEFALIRLNGDVAVKRYGDAPTAIIDRSMLEKVAGVSKSWSVTRDGYARCGIRSGDKWTTTYLHQVVKGWAPVGTSIDHINRDPRDNRVANLRFVTQSVQLTNRKNRGRYAKGVSKIKGSKKNPFRAQIQANGRLKHLGYFPTEEEAHAAWVLARTQQFIGDVVNVTINVTINK
jgi:hypothetical protein